MRNVLTVLLIGLAFSAAAAAQAPPAVHPSLYSFADIYRLAVDDAAMAGSPLADLAPGEPVLADPALLVAAGTQPQAATGLRLAIAPVRETESWLMLISGLALAGWVAHRRLAHPL